MAKIWINPAFKDKVKLKEEPGKKVKQKNKESSEKAENSTPKKDTNNQKKTTVTEASEEKIKPDKKEQKKEQKKKPQPQQKKQKTFKKSKKKNLDKTLESKFLRHLTDTQATIEATILEGPTFTGKIKWIFHWFMALKLENEDRVVIFSRLNLSHYRIKQSVSIPEEEIKKVKSPKIIKINDSFLQQCSNDKTTLIFHLRDGLTIRGTLEWYEKHLHHIKSLNEKYEYNIPRDSILYFEEFPQND